MNEALLSSKNLSWCTPADFFAELESRPAPLAWRLVFSSSHTALPRCRPKSASPLQHGQHLPDKSAKCARYFTPADDGLKMDWGGSCVFCSSTMSLTLWAMSGLRHTMTAEGKGAASLAFPSSSVNLSRPRRKRI